MTALIDTNILLDVLLSRKPFVDDSRAIWNACDDGRLNGYVSAVCLTDVFLYRAPHRWFSGGLGGCFHLP